MAIKTSAVHQRTFKVMKISVAVRPSLSPRNAQIAEAVENTQRNKETITKMKGASPESPYNTAIEPFNGRFRRPNKK
jgi:hypothetical protein